MEFSLTEFMRGCAEISWWIRGLAGAALGACFFIFVPPIIQTGHEKMADVSADTRHPANPSGRVNSSDQQAASGSAAIYIAPGAKVKGLRLERNITIGEGLLKNDGELEDADIKDNTTIIPQAPPKK